MKEKVGSEGKTKSTTTNYKEYVIPFNVKESSTIWDGRDVGYFPKDRSIFDAPFLLITGGTTSDFKSVSAISYQNSLFKSSLTAVKSVEEKDVTYLKAISAILNSSFFSYYIVQSGSSIGIEREETHDAEKWETPFGISDSLVKQFDMVEELSRKFYASPFSDSQQKKQLDQVIEQMDKEVVQLFDASNQEESLIDYTNNITIPLRKITDAFSKTVTKEMPYESKLLEEYAQVFIDHFGKRFDSDGHFFEVEIIHSNHTILMKFKIIPQPSKYTNQVVWSKEGDKELLSTLATLSFENLSKSLYLQKDVKGIESDYFYVAKPNQYKSWHPALAYLDVSEFVEAFHKFNANQS